MPRLISQEEALELGPITDRAGIEALQPRFRRKSAVAPPPDGAPNTFPEVVQMEGH